MTSPESATGRKRRRNRRPAEGGAELGDETLPGWWHLSLLALVAVAALMAGSGIGLQSLGLVVCLLGVAIVCAPPVLRLPLWPGLALVAIALLPLTGLLPADWLGIHSAWRSQLWLSWGISVPASVSPEPLATLESWMLIVSGIAWLWTCLGQRGAGESRRLCIYVLAAGGAAVAIAGIVDRSLIEIPWWFRSAATKFQEFGPFANRNHMASLNAISCILCLAAAYDAFRRKSALTWVFGLLFWAPLVAIFVNTSRGGLLLFALGLVAWVTTAAMKRGLVRKIAVILALLLAVGSVALVSSGQLGGRLRGLMEMDSAAVLTSTMRVDLARETLGVVADQPWLGYGINTFTTLFPLLTDMQTSDLRFLHPESDLLLLLFEGGLLLVIPSAIFLIWVAFAAAPWRRSGGNDSSQERAGRRLRQAAAIGAGMALIHGIIDVPNHVIGYGMHTALLLGVSVPPRRLAGLTTVFEKALFRLLGLAIVALGIVWWGIGREMWTPDLQSSVPVLRKQAIEYSRQGEHREALERVDRAIWLAPLDYRLYYHRAQLLLYLRQKPERALQDFGRSRALEPHYANNCWEEGVFWLSFAPEMAIIPWRECLRRLRSTPAALMDSYVAMLALTQTQRDLRTALWAMADLPAMKIAFLDHCQAGAEWQGYLDKFLAFHPDLEALPPQDVRSLFRSWHRLGDREALAALLVDRPKLESYGWRTVASDLARQGRFSEAVYLAAKYVKKQPRGQAALGADIPRLERAFVFNPNDARPGVDLYFAQRAQGDLKAAKATAEKVIALEQAPAYMKLELALLYAELKDDRRAWETMEQVMAQAPDL